MLADGTLLTMLDRVIKNNAGFDLKHLFFGHLGDGNLHLISGPMANDQEPEAVEAA